ncbi:MAG: hypothetical protein KA116_11475 [Proteobacteria bacterium]|jgi:hypothetical protein|nr:hypothetical protein [Pseudomonadota bacterium]
MNNVVSFEELKRRQEEQKLYQRWLSYYGQQKHEDLLEALVFEHENNFPLRNSPDMIDKLRHKALVEVLNQKAQTDFLRSFLAEIR